MIWQDYVFTAGTVFFTATLIPTALDERTAMPRYKSAPTAAILLVFAATQATLGMVVAPACEVACALCWGFIAWRRAPRRHAGTLLAWRSPCELSKDQFHPRGKR
jgi:hypothetical protein